jgi:MYXO-CTERM domain-containing protein
MPRSGRAVRHPLWLLWAVAAVSLASPAWAACPAGQVACGTGYCIPARQTCCESVGYPNRYCPAGRACNSDGLTCQGSSQSCAPTFVAGMSSCGADACGCTTTCTKNTDCATSCCATPSNATGNMYCAPSCVCQGLGSLVMYCADGSGDAGVGPARDAASWPDGGGSRDGASNADEPTRDPFGKGCSVGGHDQAGAGLLVVLVALGWWRRRARS